MGKVKERVDARNAFDGYLHSMHAAAEGSGRDKGLSEKLEPDEKERIMTAVSTGRAWLDANPEAEAEDIAETQKEVEATCAPIVSRYYGNHQGGGSEDGEEE